MKDLKSFGIKKRSVIIKMFNEVERSIEAGESKDSLLEKKKLNWKYHRKYK